MKNQVQISSDGINIYIISNVKAKAAGKIIMGIFAVAFLLLLIGLISQIENQGPGILVPILFLGLIFWFVILRYLLWNIYGEEIIIINKKTISYQYNYGLYQSNRTILKHKNLFTSIDEIRSFKDVPHGKLLFFSYDDNDLPQLLFESTILLPLEKLKEIEKEINNLFVEYFSFSLN
ncbi:MAG: hypothetical protein ACXWDO_01765 [Bacteroidia bacterium]